jgi:hypothetical protein
MFIVPNSGFDGPVTTVTTSAPGNPVNRVQPHQPDDGHGYWIPACCQSGDRMSGLNTAPKLCKILFLPRIDLIVFSQSRFLYAA